MIGRIVGNYQIQQKLGDGGMGSVYRATDLMLDRDVAIKVLRPELTGQPEIVERFRAEATTLARLQHPNIATLHSLSRDGGEWMMVMEFVRGETLERVLQQLGRVAPRTAVEWCGQILDAMQYAHRKGVVHRDIKPANLMITDEGLIKVTDFGIARVLGESRKTRTGHIIGTVTYMAPEQIRGQEVDARTDLYALGAVLFELLTGRPPFDAADEFSVMSAQVNDAPPLACGIVPGLPEWFDRAVQRALAKKPAERFQTAADFRAALAEGLQQGALPEETRVAEYVREHVERVTAPRPAPTEPVTVAVTSAAGVAPPTRLADIASRPTRLAEVTGEEPATAPVRELGLRRQLTWRHYAGAAAVVVIALAVAAMFFLRGPSLADRPVQAAAAAAPATQAPSSPSSPAADVTPSARLGTPTASEPSPPVSDALNTAPLQLAGHPAKTPPSPEIAAWQAVANTTNVKALEQFIAAFPKSQYVAVARVKIAALEPPLAPSSGAPSSATPSTNRGAFFAKGKAAYAQGDYAAAFGYYRQGAEAGDAAAMCNVGWMYGTGRGVDRDDAQAAAWYRKAIDGGSAVAMRNLGLMYASGRAVAKDEAQAAALFRKAAQAGLADAMNNLGLMYANGRGVSRDEAEAAAWYRKGAEAGNAGAMNNLGVMYANGRGVPRDEALAIEWYRKAAEAGEATAMKNLGVRYEKGNGVAHDMEEAVRWYRKSAAAGNVDAKAALDRLGRQ